ncbi:dehydrogenase [Mycobacterium intermedium]|uniref:Dehydrogenase n=1 Tax=Mycobacterium intermedium TaxID=28445 RepID=A0A1E3S834_MYCIE|nr:SDR family NAD(P)-dependent oxidoreductase [Mycobacterium intermedium]MCV6964215.1 SDR family NAD(P)-dependent oxidoreductase [Mycobacterium intermedium]ODQ98325.1 dehydrogenase [Mycobacterium intermedium]OPE48679.1 dehydrogenase [Mycobacterium intermedium]ORB03401.1 dehydrogenase [Mycobacterium intermedium]
MKNSNRAARDELIVVTGASTGMGAAAARELADNGFHVLAGVRREADADALRNLPVAGSGSIEPHILDITIASDVSAIADRVERDPLHRPLRALINNAGIAINAPVETLPLSQWRRQFEVNLFGHIAMTQALFPALLRSSGTIVNISSVGGKVVLPTYGAYAGSKFALEAVSDALRREVGDTGIKVVVVEPGAVKTEMPERGIATAERLQSDMTAAQRARYGDLNAAVTAQARSFIDTGVSAEHAAKVIAKAATSSNPRTRYTIGRDAALLVRINRVVSDRVMDRIVRLNVRSAVKRAQSRTRTEAPSTAVGAALCE